MSKFIEVTEKDDFSDYLAKNGYIKFVGEPYIYHIDNDIKYDFHKIDKPATDRYTRKDNK